MNDEQYFPTDEEHNQVEEMTQLSDETLACIYGGGIIDGSLNNVNLLSNSNVLGIVTGSLQNI